MLIGFAIAGIMAALLLSDLIWTSATGTSYKDAGDSMSDPANSNVLKLIQTITAVVGFLIPAIITASLINRKPMQLLGFSKKINGRQVLLVISIMFMALFVSSFLSYINDRIPISTEWKLYFDKLEEEYNRQVEAILALNSITDLLLSLVVMAFIPALCEEALFRGGLQNFLSRGTRLPWLAIIVVSLIFSLAHFSFYGFLSRFFLGVVLGLLYHYSGRLWLCVVAHFANNAFAVTALYYYKQQGKSLDQAMAETNSSWVGIFALPVLIVLIYLFRNITIVKKELPVNFSFENKLENPPHGV
jgi:uncharacterized protein